MPKDNEVDEKVMPVAWIVTNGGQSCEPWLVYERSELDAHPADCIADPLYSAATVAELRAEVERWKSRYDDAMQARSDEQKRADAAERRVGELEAALKSVLDANDDADPPQWKGSPVQIECLKALTGADPT